MGPAISGRIQSVHEEPANAVISNDVEAAERAAVAHSPISPASVAKKRLAVSRRGQEYPLSRFRDTIIG